MRTGPPRPAVGRAGWDKTRSESKAMQNRTMTHKALTNFKSCAGVVHGLLGQCHFKKNTLRAEQKVIMEVFLVPNLMQLPLIAIIPIQFHPNVFR